MHISTPASNQLRLVAKNGECLVSGNIPARTRILGYIKDSFTGYIDMRWRYHFLVFFGGFLFSWNVFGLLWYSTVESTQEQQQQGNFTTGTSETKSSCIKYTSNILESILFAYESQSTVGYGYRYLLEGCNIGGLVLHFLQIFVGVMLPTLLGGVVFVKSRRPKRRHETIVFSKMATISDEIKIITENSELLVDGMSSSSSSSSKRRVLRKFQFRIGNIRQSHIVSTSVRVILVKDRKTKEGEIIPFCMHQLQISTFPGGDAGDACENPSLAFLPWPMLISHEINEESPMRDLQKDCLNFEVIVLLEGVIESTGKPSQFRTSYAPDEILWQHKFAPIVMEFKSSRGRKDVKDQISVDFSTFNQTIPLNRTFSREEIIARTELTPMPPNTSSAVN